MYNYVYKISKSYDNNKIKLIQTKWRLIQLNRALINKNIILSNYYLKLIFRLETNANYSKYLFMDIDKFICKYDTELMILIRLYRNCILFSIRYLIFSKNMIKQNIEKYMFIIIVNKTIKEFNKFNIKMDELIDITKQYVTIYNSNIDNKYDILKHLLILHINKAEKLFNKYGILSCGVIKENIKDINSKTYENIYNNFICSKNIIEMDFNYKKYYNILNCFFTYNNVYDYLFNNIKTINTSYNFKNLLDNMYYIVNNI